MNKPVEMGTVSSVFLISAFCIIISALFFHIHAKETPSWVQGLGRSEYFSYPRFITGYAVCHVENPKNMGKAVLSARENACAMLISSLKSTFTVRSRMESSYLYSYSRERVIEELSNTVLSEGTLELQNLRTEFFYDKKTKNVHVLVWIDREKQIMLIRSRLSALSEIVGTHAVMIESFINSGELGQAAKTYELAAPHLEDLKRDGLLLELFTLEPYAQKEAHIAVLSLMEQLYAKLRLDEKLFKDASGTERKMAFDVWSGAGADSIFKNESYRFFVNASGPMYLRILCKLENGLTVVPDPLFKNFFLNGPLSDYALPGLFHIPDLLPVVSVEFLVYEEPFDEVGISGVVIGEGVYLVVSDKMKIKDGIIRRFVRVVERTP
ncbi:MAG: hypothetical protein LBI42_13675 [Chitinispirillales bacterium]|jgi:hypothetical protein|nr:hypothetical protein [Chitinispirillales bacterium]